MLNFSLQGRVPRPRIWGSRRTDLVAALVNNSGGAADGIIAAAGGGYVQGDENDNRTDIAVKINELQTALTSLGLL